MSSDNEQEQIKKLRDLAKQEDKAAVESYLEIGRSGWEHAKHAAAVHGQNLYTYLGFETFDDWIAGRNMERSTCRMWLRRYEELIPTFSFAEMRKLSGQNADFLLRLPVKQRTEAMLRKGQEMPTPEFLKVIEKALQRLAPADAPAPELSTPLKIMMPSSKKQFVEDSMKDFAKSQGLESETPSRVMELMVATAISSELNEAQLLVSYLIPELKAMHELIQDKSSDPRWLLDQFGMRLENALKIVLKPQEFIKKSRSKSSVQALDEITAQQSAENAENFFKGNGNGHADLTPGQRAVADTPLEVMRQELGSTTKGRITAK